MASLLARRLSNRSQDSTSPQRSREFGFVLTQRIEASLGCGLITDVDVRLDAEIAASGNGPDEAEAGSARGSRTSCSGRRAKPT
jgi:hypothetical protein